MPDPVVIRSDEYDGLALEGELNRKAVTVGSDAAGLLEFKRCADVPMDHGLGCLQYRQQGAE